MALELSNMQLTLEQSQEQRLLRIVRVGYAYTLLNTDKNTGTAGTQDPAEPFIAEIDILGDDVFVDDLLVKGVDRHEVSCAPGANCTVQRDLIVAQALLDEDLSDDEIKLRVHVKRGKEAPVVAVTPIVRGKF